MSNELPKDQAWLFTEGQTPQSGLRSTCIAGLDLFPLAVISAAGGPVLHMVRRDSCLFSGFGEVYFSQINPGAIKGWKRHQRQIQLFAVPVGVIRLAVYDLREHSPSYKSVETLLLGRPENYALLRVPPGLWYAFQGLSAGPALLANCTDLPHDPLESEILPLDSPYMPRIFCSNS